LIHFYKREPKKPEKVEADRSQPGHKNQFDEKADGESKRPLTSDRNLPPSSNCTWNPEYLVLCARGIGFTGNKLPLMPPM